MYVNNLGEYVVVKNRFFFPENYHQKQILRVKIFWPICIVFISPPGVELRVLSLYIACFVVYLCYLLMIHTVYTLPFPHYIPRGITQNRGTKHVNIVRLLVRLCIWRRFA